MVTPLTILNSISPTRYRCLAMKPEPLFYVQREEQNVAGPYDLVQMAGLLRRKIITGETMARLEGEDAWKPFAWHSQYSIVREMPADAVSTRVANLDEEAAVKQSGPIPMPSTETLGKLAGMVVGSLLAGAGGYVVAWADVATGTCLEFAGGGAAIVAQCIITLQLLDEDRWTLAFVFFVPFGEIYYFITNFWQYFTWFCVKYIGAAVALGAMLGLATHLGH